MTAPVGIQEIEEVDAPEVDAAVLVPRETRRCACGAVRMGDAVRHGDEVCVPIVHEAVAVETYPEPLITSRDVVPLPAWVWDAELPGGLLKQAEKASKAGWEVRVQRSRGCLPHATHGTPGAVKTLHALILRKGGASAYAIHDGTKWGSVVTWGVGAPWFAGMASITDLGEYLLAGGVMPKSWYAAIRAREAGKDARGKSREECNRGVHKGAKLTAGLWKCPLCENTWGAREPAWRRSKTTERDTAR